MNCLEFRRTLLQDPFDDNAEMHRHEEACSDCRHFAAEQRAQEHKLRSLLGDVNPPPELAENIQLAAHMERRGQMRRQVWFATAASVLLIVGATITSLVHETWERGNMALAHSVLNHIDDEAHHLREAGPASNSRVNFVFKRFGAELVGDLGPVNFAAECLMRKRNGVHLVLPGKLGPITVFFMPGEHAERAIEVDSDRFQGHIEPMAWGSIAVVGEHGENLEGMAGRMGKAVNWPTANSVGSVELTNAALVTQQ